MLASTVVISYVRMRAVLPCVIFFRVTIILILKRHYICFSFMDHTGAYFFLLLCDCEWISIHKSGKLKLRPIGSDADESYVDCLVIDGVLRGMFLLIFNVC